MPFFDNFEDENQLEPGQVQLSGASPTDSTAEAEPNQPKQKQDTGSGFQNLDKYLSTNQPKEFGNQLLGKVQGTIDGAKENQNQASDQFKQKVTSADVLPTQNQVNQSIAAPDQANAKEFQGWLSNTYDGPKSLAEDQSSFNKFNSGTQNAATQSKLLGSESGRFGLLDNFFGRPSYSFGEKSLDNLLVQQAGLGKETRGLQNQAAQLKSQGDLQAKNLQGFAAQRAGEVDQNRKAARSAVGLDDNGQVILGDNAGALGKSYQEVGSKLTAENAARKAEQDSLRQGSAIGQLSQDQLSKLGLAAGQNLYNLDLSNYINYGGELSRNQVMTPEQRSYIRALSQMTGIEDTFAQGDAQDPSAIYGFDNNKFQADLASAQGGYKQAYGGALDVVKNLAPFTGDYLRSLSVDTNPQEILTKLDQEQAMWEQELRNGNPYSNNRLDQISKSRSALMGALNPYTPDRVLKVK